MKQAQNARQQRGRPSSRQGGKSNRGPGNHRNEQKIRGNPKQLVEKYQNQARECLQAGDRMQAEYYFQFAEHYYRVLNENRNNSANQSDRDGQQNNRQQNNNRNQGQNGNGSAADDQQGGRQQRRGRRGRPQGDHQQNTNGNEQQANASQPNGVDTSSSDVETSNRESTKPDVQSVDKPAPQVAGDQTKDSQPAEKLIANKAESGAPIDGPAQPILNDSPAKPARRRAPRKSSAPAKDAGAAPPLDPAASDLT